MVRNRTDAAGAIPVTQRSADGLAIGAWSITPWRLLRTLVIVAVIACGTARAVSAETDPSAICERAAVIAAAETGVPVSVLKAITLTETGRDRNGATRPWPWTVNMEGDGVWFDTVEDARAYAHEHFKRGARSFDLGCFQINYKWHHEAFSSIDEMFDPAANALYAARFLAELYAELGDWDSAAGAYHSRTPEHAERYRERFAAFRARLAGQDGLPLTRAATGPLPSAFGPAAQPDAAVAAARPGPRVNTYPLLQSGGGAALGSLVPLSASGSGASLFRPGDAG